MREVWRTHRYCMDPHTAVGWVALRKHGARAAIEVGGTAAGTGGPVVLLSTAHPGKFLDTVRQAVGFEPELPPRLAAVLDRPGESITMEPSVEILQSFLLDRYQ